MSCDYEYWRSTYKDKDLVELQGSLEWSIMVCEIGHMLYTDHEMRMRIRAIQDIIAEIILLGDSNE